VEKGPYLAFLKSCDETVPTNVYAKRASNTARKCDRQIHDFVHFWGPAMMEFSALLFPDEDFCHVFPLGKGKRGKKRKGHTNIPSLEKKHHDESACSHCGVAAAAASS